MAGLGWIDFPASRAICWVSVQVLDIGVVLVMSQARIVVASGSGKGAEKLPKFWMQATRTLGLKSLVTRNMIPALITCTRFSGSYK